MALEPACVLVLARSLDAGSPARPFGPALSLQQMAQVRALHSRAAGWRVSRLRDCGPAMEAAETRTTVWAPIRRITGCPSWPRPPPFGVRHQDRQAQVQLTINGDSRNLDHLPTVAALVDALGLDPRKVAVERNLEIVPKSAYAATGLCDGDRIEIVHFIGGG